MKEKEREADELANLVHMKCDIMKTLENRMAQVKKKIAELQSKVEQLCSEHTEPPQQKQEELEHQDFFHPVSTHSLAGINECYAQVLQAKNDNNCSMANAFHLAGGPRSTLRDLSAIN